MDMATEDWRLAATPRFSSRYLVPLFASISQQATQPVASLPFHVTNGPTGFRAAVGLSGDKEFLPKNHGTSCLSLGARWTRRDLMIMKGLANCDHWRKNVLKPSR